MPPLTRDDILAYLRETDPGRIDQLRREADRVRRQAVGDEVHLRGLVEISNHCVRGCTYCGIRHDHDSVRRYRMRADEILACARRAHQLGYGTVVMQAGEDYGIGRDWMAELIRAIKDQTGRAVTLSLGERPEEDLVAWKRAGADRYLLRFETSDRHLYKRIHPDRGSIISDRLTILETLRNIGYETGTGVMIGIPGQSWETLAEDISLFAKLDIDMVGVGPYIAHPDTPLARHAHEMMLDDDRQVPADQQTTLKVVALTRLVCPEANIPATTALSTLSDRGRESGLAFGANVIMPNLTPMDYRRLYEIYPAKSCLAEDPQAFHDELLRRLSAIGRRPGTGPGHRKGRA